MAGWANTLRTVASGRDGIWVMGFRRYACDIAHNRDSLVDNIDKNAHARRSGRVPCVQVSGDAFDVK